MESGVNYISYVVKVCIVGDSGVGKSSIALRFARDVFHTNMMPTLGAGFLSRSVISEKGQAYKFHIWDTAGQERYRSLVPLYYHGAAVVLIVFDVTKRESLTAGAAHWIRELRHTGPSDAVYALVGNKADLDETEREVTAEEGQRHAQQMGAIYCETSAKSGEHIVNLFSTLCQRLEDTGKDLPCVPYRSDSSCSTSTNDSATQVPSWLKDIGDKLSYTKKDRFSSKTLKIRIIGEDSSLSTSCCSL